MFVPVTVIGELSYGAYRSNDPSGHIIQVQSFLQNCKILLADSATADIYDNIKSGLTKKGKPIPEKDIWIAPVALQHNLPLFTTDNHFKEIENISLI